MNSAGEDFAALAARLRAAKPAGVRRLDTPSPSRLAAPAAPASVPAEWLAGIARLETGDCPAAITAKRWAVFLGDCRKLRDRGFLAQAARLGWSTRDVFGIHATHPAPRHDCAGLAWMLDGADPALITADRCAMRSRHGGSLTYYRRELPFQSVPAWALVEPMAAERSA